MITALISRIVILGLGTLYPAYASYKAIKTKDLKEYSKWIMYWIVFALFTSVECFADIFIGFWFPFYYELKILLVIWLLSPFTKGASIMYKNVVHPLFTRKEQDIDEYIAKIVDQGYSTMLKVGSTAFSSITNIIMTTAIRGGNGLFYHLKKSYSLNDLYTENGKKNCEMLAISKSKTSADCYTPFTDDAYTVNKLKKKNKSSIKLMQADDEPDSTVRVRRRRENKLSSQESVVCNGPKNGMVTRSSRLATNRKSNGNLDDVVRKNDTEVLLQRENERNGSCMHPYPCVPYAAGPSSYDYYYHYFDHYPLVYRHFPPLNRQSDRHPRYFDNPSTNIFYPNDYRYRRPIDLSEFSLGRSDNYCSKSSPDLSTLIDVNYLRKTITTTTTTTSTVGTYTNNSVYLKNDVEDRRCHRRKKYRKKKRAPPPPSLPPAKHYRQLSEEKTYNKGIKIGNTSEEEQQQADCHRNYVITIGKATPKIRVEDTDADKYVDNYSDKVDYSCKSKSRLRKVLSKSRQVFKLSRQSKAQNYDDDTTNTSDISSIHSELSIEFHDQIVVSSDESITTRHSYE